MGAVEVFRLGTLYLQLPTSLLLPFLLNLVCVYRSAAPGRSIMAARLSPMSLSHFFFKAKRVLLHLAGTEFLPVR